MNYNEIDNYLFTWNSYEIKQFETGESINDIPGLTSDLNKLFDASMGYFRLPKAPFFQESNIYISKHNRFANMIEHVHDFIEINYVYSGECIQSIKGKNIHLPKGTFCVLDRDVPHAIEPLGENDILINILLNNQTFSSLFLFQLEKDQSLLGSFLLEAFNQQSAHDNFMLFDASRVPNIHVQMKLMLSEFWTNEHKTIQLVEQYLQLIISELMRIYQKDSTSKQDSTGFDYIAVLNYIDEHYQDLRLHDLKKAFNYNSNYISNSLKKATGKNFQEILLEKKMLVALDLLKHSSLPIDQIAETIGFNSISYFYRQFKKKYKHTPKHFRNKHAGIP